MSSVRDHVREFHLAFGQPVHGTPRVPDDERVRLRLRLIAEEFFELLDGCLDWHTNPRALDAARVSAMDAIENVPVRLDLVEAADALADLDYVIEGTRLEFGIDGRPIAAEVHRSNMSKLGPDGKPVWRQDGKVVKPAGWTPPDVAGELKRQGWEP